MSTLVQGDAEITSARKRSTGAATFVAIVVAAVTALLTAGAGSAAAATHQTRDGHTIVLHASGFKIRSIPPLDGSTFSREARLSSDVHAAIRGIKKGETVRAKLEVGYQIGYPVSVAPSGVKITAHTPELKLTGGVNAKIEPSATISGTGGGAAVGELGAEAGAEATVIPSADLEFEVAAGKITTVTLAEIALTKPTANVTLSGIGLNVTNALGPVSVRPFTKISVTTDTGVYVYTTYAATKQL